MEENLSRLQAYKAMFKFINSYYVRKGKPLQLGNLLSDIQLLPDNTSADPASWYDWLEAVNQVVAEEDLDEAA